MIKNVKISTNSPKTEINRFFSNPDGEIFVQNSICYKKFPNQISHINAEFSQPLVVTHFCSKEFNRSLFIRGGILLGGVTFLGGVAFYRTNMGAILNLIPSDCCRKTTRSRKKKTGIGDKYITYMIFL